MPRLCSTATFRIVCRLHSADFVQTYQLWDRSAGTDGQPHPTRSDVSFRSTRREHSPRSPSGECQPNGRATDSRAFPFATGSPPHPLVGPYREAPPSAGGRHPARGRQILQKFRHARSQGRGEICLALRSNVGSNERKRSAATSASALCALIVTTSRTRSDSRKASCRAASGNARRAPAHQARFWGDFA
jgi:hypothetical protein